MKIAVLAGGRSTERNVSISSGYRITNALREQGYQSTFIDLFLGRVSIICGKVLQKGTCLNFHRGVWKSRWAIDFYSFSPEANYKKKEFYPVSFFHSLYKI